VARIRGFIGRMILLTRKMAKVLLNCCLSGSILIFMAITISTKKPTELLLSICKAIRDREITTWIVDEAGDFTHNLPQWRNQAWLQPQVVKGDLVFTIVPQSRKTISPEIYAVYHGRFTEMLLGLFDSSFSKAYASARPEKGDSVG
jgi:hypothetical protein